MKLHFRQKGESIHTIGDTTCMGCYSGFPRLHGSGCTGLVHQQTMLIWNETEHATLVIYECDKCGKNWPTKTELLLDTIFMD